jgi:hypothetical protein
MLKSSAFTSFMTLKVAAKPGAADASTPTSTAPSAFVEKNPMQIVSD